MYKFIALFLIFLGCTFQIKADPNITSLSPSNGSFNGNNPITLNGSGFTNTTAVNFGTTPALSFNVISDSVISAIVPPGVPGTVDVIVTANSQNSSISPVDFYTYTQDSWRGVLSEIDSDGVTLFDTATNTLTLTIPLPTDSPGAIITPNGKRIYTANTGPNVSDQNVSVIDVATNQIIATIPTTVGPGAFDIIVSPDGTRVYVSNNTSGFVTVIDTTSNTVVTNVFIAPNLGPLSITPDGKTVYVGNFTQGNVTTINTTTNTVGTSIPTGVSPGMISITPNGAKAFVANFGSDTVSVIDIALNLVVNTIIFPPSSSPYGSSILPNGKTMYVANINNDTVTIVDIASEMITGTISLLAGSQPFWVVSTPDSKTVYVATEGADSVTPIDVATNTAGSPFGNTQSQLQDMVMSPDPAPVAAFSTAIRPVGFPSIFNASASISPIGSIVLYEWDFGDSTTLAANTPIINHIYTTPGSFTVTLTVTNSAGTSTTKIFSSRFMSNNGGPQATIQHSITVSTLNPPIDVKGKRKCNEFLTQTEFFNVLTWKTPPGVAPVAYNIYRDAGLTQRIGIVTAGTLKFIDHNLKKHKTYTYFIASVDVNGDISSTVSITVKP